MCLLLAMTNKIEFNMRCKHVDESGLLCFQLRPYIMWTFNWKIVITLIRFFLFNEQNPSCFVAVVWKVCSNLCFSFPGSSGGICEKSKLYSDGKKKSLNTGIITVQNYASHVPPKVSHITFAHEVGHNFGSPVSFLDVPHLCMVRRNLISLYTLSLFLLT